MENSNSERNNPNIQETEAYFDSLLKKQATEFAQERKSPLKPLALLFIFVVILTGLYFAVSYYMNSTNPVVTGSKSAENKEPVGAYFNPEYYTQTGRTKIGRISKSLYPNEDSRRNFELLSNDGKTIAYLYSNAHDLNLSISLEVEVQGRFSGTTPEGIEIIEVSSIKLK